MVSNWGHFPIVEANVTGTSDYEKVRQLVLDSDVLIARGNGRCYGDSSLGSNIFSTLRLDHFLSFDPGSGIIECESGVLLSDVLDLCVPKGFFLPVTPGTKFITVGGAIAADVHGKNHHVDGSFSNHVIEIALLNDVGDLVACSPDLNADLFWRTCGGMGLTGIILTAKFRLKPIETAYMTQTAEKANDIDAVMKLFETSADSTYSVAWLDCFAGRGNLGRSILLLGEHCWRERLPLRLASDPLKAAPSGGLALPFHLPAFSVNYLSVKALNFAYYHKQFSRRAETIVHFDPYFYPLDGIGHWNRAYGKKGFVQYQFVLPRETGYDSLIKILEKIRASGQGSPLAVLKLFGNPDPRAVMSFPIEGYTLALDFKVNAQVFRLLDELDEIVLASGGRIYLAKDARMSAQTFHSSYSNIVASGKFRSAQAERLEF